MRERDAEIVQRVLSGETLHSVGRDFLITRERVRQIVKRDAPEYAPRRRAVTAQRRLDTDQRKRTAQRKRAEQMRTTVAERPAPPRVWTSEEMLLCMAEMFSVHGDISMARWRLISRQELVPSAALYVVRFGGWNAAKRLAGLSTANRRALDSYQRQFTDEDLIDAVALFLRTANPLDGEFGAQHYDRWSKQVPHQPSLALVRTRLGTWSSVKQQAIQLNETRPATKDDA